MNITKITKSLALGGIGGTLIAGAGGYYNGHVTHKEDIEQIRHEIYSNIPNLYNTLPDISDMHSMHKYEKLFRNYMQNAEEKDNFVIWNRLDYWKDVQKKADKIKKSMQGVVDYTNEKRHDAYVIGCIKKDLHNNFINSQEFKDFIKNQKVSKKEFLKKNKNYKLVQTTKIKMNQYNDNTKFYDLKSVKAVEKRETPYRELAYREKSIPHKKDNGKGYSIIYEHIKVPYDKNPYKDIKCFFRVEQDDRSEAKILVCEKYADPNQ